jgi:small-conductance mechanosensitive channel
MTFPHPWHSVAAVAALAATAAVSSLTANRLIRRKLRLSFALLGAYLVFHLALAVQPSLTVAFQGNQIASVERLAFAAGLINLLVITFLNPLRVDRVPDRYPAILQEFIVVGLVLLVATFVFQDTLLATSAVSAVVIGFALQDTLGNAFAGLAIQSEKPFHVGHWIRVGDFEGRVAEVTWRATKLRTKSGNFVVLPNNIVSKEAITNYSEPAAPTRIEVQVGASYLTAPNIVKAAIREAIENAPRAMKEPPPDVILGSRITSVMRRRATRCGRQSTTPSRGTTSRFRGRSRCNTSGTGTIPRSPMPSRNEIACWRASIYLPRSTSSNAGRSRRRHGRARTGMAKPSSSRATREIRCSWSAPVARPWCSNPIAGRSRPSSAAATSVRCRF